MNPETEMQAIVEAAGEKWLGIEFLYDECGDIVDLVDGACDNPSPTDMNELMRLARKDVFCISHIEFEYKANGLIVCRLNKGEFISQEVLKPADALRQALYQATKGE